jgi:hypothetical protein
LIHSGKSSESADCSREGETDENFESDVANEADLLLADPQGKRRAAGS